MNFYTINEKHKALIYKAEVEAEENDGEISDIIYNELVNSEANMIEFGETFLLMAKEKMLMSEAIKEECKMLEARSKKLAEQSEKYKMLAINECGAQAGERAQFDLKCTKSVATKIKNPTAIPKEYIRVKTSITETPAKDEILKALKSGKVVSGCVLEERINWKLK